MKFFENDNLNGAARMAASMALFTFNDICMKALADELPLFQALFLRGILGSIALGVLAWWMGAFRFNYRGRDRWLVALRTVSEIGAAYFFLSALFNMPIANITAVLQALPLTVSLAGAVFLGEKIGWRRILAISIGFFGVLLIVRPGAADFSIFSLYAVATVIVVTVRDLASRRLSKDVPSLAVAFLAAVAVMLFSGAMSITEEWASPSAWAWAQLIGAVVFITGAYISSVSAMRIGDIGTIAPIRYTGLLWALFLGWLVFGEWPDALTILGSLIIVATGVFTLLREQAIGSKKAGRH